LRNASTVSGGIFDVAEREARIAELDGRAAAPDFWNDAEKAQSILKERSELSEPVATWRKQLEGLEDIKVFAELAAEGDPDAEAEARAQYESIAATTMEQDPLHTWALEQAIAMKDKERSR